MALKRVTRIDYTWGTGGWQAELHLDNNRVVVLQLTELPKDAPSVAFQQAIAERVAGLYDTSAATFRLLYAP
jgi:hypothetical protein